MSLELLFLVVSATLCVASEKKPGLLIMHTEKSLKMVHQELILGKKLDEKLNHTNIPSISGNLSTIIWSELRFSLTEIKPVAYRSPKVNVAISSTDGILIDIVVPAMELVGKHQIRHVVGSWGLEEWTGEFRIRITETELKMKRNVTSTGTEKVTWKSTDLTGSIKVAEVKFNDEKLNTLFALVDSKKLDEMILNNLFEACKYVTEYEMDNSYNITDDIYLDMSLVQPMITHDGDVEFHHKAEPFFRGDTRTYNNEPLELVPYHPNTPMLYRMSDSIFNRFGNIVHDHQLLSYNFSKVDLPETHKQRLDTTCENDCFGKLFPEAAEKFPGSSIEIEVSTTAAPFIQTTPTSSVVVLEFRHIAKARKGDEPPKDVFNVYVCLVASVHLSVKDNKVHVELQLLQSNITVIESQCGVLPKENLAVIIDVVFEKGLTPVVEKLKNDGLALILPELHKVSDYETMLRFGDIALMMELEDIHYVNRDKSSIRDIDWA